MPGQPNVRGSRRVSRSSSCSPRTSDLHGSPQDSSDREEKRSPLLSGPKSSAKFDTQVETLPNRFQEMTRIAEAGAATEKKKRQDSPLQEGGNIPERAQQLCDENAAVDSQFSAQNSSFKRDQRGIVGVKVQDAERAAGLVVALFHDGFVCRHINKENEGVEGFAQPYDAESSYFLACVDNGRVPEGLPDSIAYAHNNGSVLAEIRDYRETRSALCPVSSAFLPAASALPQTTGSSSCRVWQTLLVPGKSPLPIHAQFSPLFEPPTLQSMFDHFPDVSPDELETLALDAQRQLLLEEDVWPSSSSTESSSPCDESRRFRFPQADIQETQSREENDEATRLTTTPTTRPRFQCGLATSPSASLLSPIERKSARSCLNGQEETSTKRCKRQIETKGKGAAQVDIGLKIDNSSNSAQYGSGKAQDMSRSLCPRQLRGGFSELLANDSVPVTPFPATQLFLSKLKGKQLRPENELLYGKPAWVTIAHVGRFFRAATRLEREHSRFLQVNARRLMQVEKPPPAETEHVAGSMRYLARQLGDLTRPSDVVAVADARELKVAQDEGRELHKPDWMENGCSSLSLTWQSAESSAALVASDSEPALHLQRLDADEDTLLGQFFDLSDTASLMQDYQPNAAAPHFNAFDDDGNLQLQSA